MKEKSIRYNSIKIVLIFLVIIGHVVRMYTNESVYNFYSNLKYMEYIMNFIYGFHMPLFIMISGSIFSLCLNELNKYQDRKKFIITKLKRLIIPYLFIGIIVMPPILKYTNIIDESIISYIINGILLGKNSRHLWFLSNLFFIFIIFIFLPNKNKFKVFVVYTLACIIIYFFNIYYISTLAYWSLFFYIGYIFNNYYDKIKIIPKYIYIILLGIYICLIYVDLPQKFLQIYGGVLFYLIFVNLDISKYIPDKISKITMDYSMGIYLFHPIIIYLLFYIVKDISINTIFLCLGAIIFSYLISIFISFIFKKLKLNVLLGDK